MADKYNRTTAWMLRALADALGEDHDFFDEDGDLCWSREILITAALELEHVIVRKLPNDTP